jgi:Zn-dependent protease
VSANAIYLVTIWAIPVIIAVTFHEAAHGFVAYLLGDDTAWRLGRVSFNPLKHVDPFGTILMPGVLLLLRSPFIFGYAKPVPVNFRALRWPRRGMVLVAAAGPVMNIALAVAAAPATRSTRPRKIGRLVTLEKSSGVVAKQGGPPHMNPGLRGTYRLQSPNSRLDTSTMGRVIRMR